MGIYEELQARGLIAQVTDEERIRNLINNGEATFYIGFDCTADSLTAGHFMALTLMKRLQMAGNKPIALIGGGTQQNFRRFATLKNRFAEICNHHGGAEQESEFYAVDPPSKSVKIDQKPKYHQC